ncbi:MAG: aminopeptidase P family protein [Candidatus Omnitrophica bacterium]|nr:aminopeptidase P family protein [Candidatus Omnitrophota bacterium]
MYRERLSKFARAMKSHGLHAAVLTKSTDIVYLAGFFCEKAMLIVTPGKRTVYLIDTMNHSLAASELKAQPIEVVMSSDKAAFLSDWIRNARVKKLGIDYGSFSLDIFMNVKSEAPRVDFVDASEPIGRTREIKDDGEITLIKKAAKLTSAVWKFAVKNIATGMTEVEVAHMIDSRIREIGYTNSFKTIAAAGSNSAFPHAIPGSKVYRKNDHLILDFGLVAGNYCSDLTRVLSNGRMKREISALYDAVKHVHDEAIKMIKPGIKISSLVKRSHKYFIDNNFGKYVAHGLGHGLGMDVHERPFISGVNDSVLKNNMVITIEPGLYVPGLGGVRIEDMVLVNQKGCEVLSVC